MGTLTGAGSCGALGRACPAQGPVTMNVSLRHQSVAWAAPITTQPLPGEVIMYALPMYGWG